jgi:hypothetical protein
MDSVLAGAIFWGVPLAYILFVGFRAPKEEFVRGRASAYGLELSAANRDFVSAYLRRSKRIRTVGALAGVITSVVWTAVTEDSTAFISNGLIMAAAGYLAGAFVAEFLLQRPQAKGSRLASLVPRTLGDYLPRTAIAIQRGLPVLSLALIPVYAGLQGRPRIPVRIGVGGFALISVVVVGGAILVEAAQRMVVRRAQPVLPPDLLSADDAVRSASVHAMAGAGIALMLFALSYQLASVGSVTDIEPLGWIFPVLAIVALGLALASWIDLGHPKAWRVRRTVPDVRTA